MNTTIEKNKIASTSNDLYKLSKNIYDPQKVHLHFAKNSLYINFQYISLVEKNIYS